MSNPHFSQISQKGLSRNESILLSKQPWLDATEKNVKRQHTLARSGQAGILAKNPEIRDEIKMQLQALCTSRLAVNLLVAQSLMIAIIQNHAPELLTKFKCSEVSLFYLNLRFMVLLIVLGICPFFHGKCDGLDSSKRRPRCCPLACRC
jgi:hypothetical protein